MPDESIPLILPNKRKQRSICFSDFQCCENNYFTGSFGKVLINVPPCIKPATLSAIYFKIGHYNEDDSHPELVGFDCPLDESPRIYACSEQDLRALIYEIFDKNSYGDISGTFPDVIFDSCYAIKRKIQIRMFNDYGYAADKSHFTNLHYSSGRESLDSLWKREKWHFI